MQFKSSSIGAVANLDCPTHMREVMISIDCLDDRSRQKKRRGINCTHLCPQRAAYNLVLPFRQDTT